VLTQKQQAVFDFLLRYFTQHRRSPLIREIQLGCQIASYKSALDRLNALERKGFIRRLANKHRGIRILRKALGPKPAEPPLVSSPITAPSPAAASNTGEGFI
jgi:SOS-response transcriptional repressor LexA